MASKPERVEDDRGQQWLVFPGDPAWEYVRVLVNKGLAYLVLPRETLTTGALTEWDAPAMISWDTSNAAVATVLRRYQRLKDTLQFLNGTERHPPIPSSEEPAVGAGGTDTNR